MRKTFLILTLGLLSASASLRADTYPRQPGVDAIHYVFRLTITDANNEIAGESTATVKFVTASVKEFVLDLTSVSAGKGMTVSAVTCSGQPVQFSHSADQLHIPLGQPSKPGDELAVHHQLPRRPGRRPAPDQQHPRRAHRLQRELAQQRAAVAADDRPPLRQGDRRVHRHGAGALPGRRQRAAGRGDSICPATSGARTGSSRCRSRRGSTRSASRASRRTTTPRRQRRPAAGRGCSRRTPRTAQTRLRTHRPPRVRVLQRPDRPLRLREARARAGGRPRRRHRARDAPSSTARRASRSVDAPVVHEVAHQWFGNAVTERDWDDVWLSEGFATYFTLLYTEQFEGRDAFVRGLRTQPRAASSQLEKKPPDTPVIHRNLSDMRRVLNQFVYQKGGWTLHMLRGDHRHRAVSGPASASTTAAIRTRTRRPTTCGASWSGFGQRPRAGSSRSG